ncbi:hypothetical protein Pint_28796 [Pistacia integerrima]|uniref:Uncharacterized protein n=1 Tax=Pistacia integerrima TaxID=434235 RepID=A0ACC0WWR6_9ROSI|nr:hypothetical protein Pint_28796 [Pistacia integerrima]
MDYFVDGNPDLCPEVSCKGREKNKLTVPVAVVPIVAVVVLICVILTAISIFWNFKTRKQVGKKNESLDSKTRRYKYSDLVRFTNNFERTIGKGGFGKVYHGYLDDTQVAVKMLSQSSVQGYKQFKAEIELLMRVHHKNLTTLVGYCDESTNMGLIYEFMANGNLQSHLIENDVDTLSWEGRLRIATEAAQGDIANIVDPRLHGDFETNSAWKAAEIAVACVSPTSAKRPTMTQVVMELNESLVIEIARKNVGREAESNDSNGDIKNIVDPRFNGDFDINSVWKAVEIAMACVSRDSTKRPTMHQVVMELNESLAIEIGRAKAGSNNKSKDHNAVITLNLNTELSPVARTDYSVVTVKKSTLPLSSGMAVGNVQNLLPCSRRSSFLKAKKISWTCSKDFQCNAYGNPDLCPEVSCEGREKNKLVVPIAVVPIVAVVVSICIILTAISIFWNLKTRKQVGEKNESLDSKTRRYKYSDLVRFTINFERTIGKGGFRTVYHGYLDDTQVPVKMLSQSSVQGYKEFKAEIELLMRVHHKNLTTLVGYCDECANMGLVYEFMANGNLQSHLLETDADTLSWEGRLRIATEAAQEVAMTCVSPTSAKRPTMNQVAVELNESLAMEVARKKMGKDAKSRDSMLSMNLNVDTELSPIPR